jgi:S-DNA-T family DNA segregation ATPase FtsK/SpoIIIE
MQHSSSNNEPIIVRQEKRSRTTQTQSGGSTSASDTSGGPVGSQRSSREQSARTTRSTPSSEVSSSAPSTPDRRRRRHILGLALAVGAVILLIAMLSYSRSDDANASLSLREIIGLFRGDEAVRLKAESVHNLLGIFGAVLAHFFFLSTIGFASLLLPFGMLMWSKHIYKNTVHDRLIVASMLGLAMSIAIAGVMGTVQKISWMPELGPEWSGAVGQFLSAIFSQLLGKIGALMIFFLAMIVALILGIDLDIEKSLLRLQWEISKLRDRWEQRSRSAPHSEQAQEEEEETVVDTFPSPAPVSIPRTSVKRPTVSAPFYDRPIEPARIIRKNAEKQGTDSSLQDLVQKYEQPLQRPHHTGQNLTMTDTEQHSHDGQLHATESSLPSSHEMIAIQRIPASSSLPTPPLEEAIQERTPPAVNHSSAKYTPTIHEDIGNEKTGHSSNMSAPMQAHKTNQSLQPLPTQGKPLTLTVQEQEEEEKTTDRVLLDKQSMVEDIHYIPPTIDLLVEEDETSAVDDEELKHNAQALQEKLRTFKIEIEDVQVTPGPVVTQYEFVPAAGIKVSQIENLSDDIALALKARGIRIIAPVPGRGTVAVEIPNHKPAMVRFSSIIRSPKFKDNSFKLPLALGKTISGEVYCADLSKMPHLLIAGSTGSGKSVGINTIICSLIYRMHPKDLKFVIIDPKKVEMTPYRPLIKHFLAVSPDINEHIITNPQNAVIALKAVVVEMENRYEILSKVGQRNIADYNQKVQEGKFRDTTEMVHREMPYIVVVIDELADLMMTSGNDVEEPIVRIAQLARAVGIHLVIATQRPSVDVITGIIKVNVPARIAYAVASKIDSRTILDTSGAEHLIGNGDMLCLTSASPLPQRLQNAYLSTDEVEAITQHIAEQKGYSQPFMLPSIATKNTRGDSGDINDRDDLFEDAARLVVRHQQASTSLVQRKLKVGYSRAARIIDQLEEAGILGQFDGKNPREILVESESELESYL